jgi:hypothetical protein
VTDRAKPDRQDDEVSERPSSELVTARSSTAEVEDDIAETQRKMEFAAVERLIFFTDAVVAIALTLLAKTSHSRRKPERGVDLHLGDAP